MTILRPQLKKKKALKMHATLETPLNGYQCKYVLKQKVIFKNAFNHDFFQSSIATNTMNQ